MMEKKEQIHGPGRSGPWQSQSVNKAERPKRGSLRRCLDVQCLREFPLLRWNQGSIAARGFSHVPGGQQSERQHFWPCQTSRETASRAQDTAVSTLFLQVWKMKDVQTPQKIKCY